MAVWRVEDGQRPYQDCATLLEKPSDPGLLGLDVGRVQSWKAFHFICFLTTAGAEVTGRGEDLGPNASTRPGCHSLYCPSPCRKPGRPGTRQIC